MEGDGDFLLPVGTVTLLLADVEGSTRRWEESEGAMAAAMESLGGTVSELVGRHHGVRPLEQGEGDSFVAAFPLASDAVACAIEIQRSLLDGRLALRIGIHSGEAQRRADKTYVGPAVNRTARLRDAAHGGQIVASQAAAELTADRLPKGVALRDLGRHRLKDLARPEHVYQVFHPELRDAFPPLRSLDTYRHNLPEHRTPLFGRERETAEASELIRSERLVALTGVGGGGKTRLGLHLAAQLLDDHPDGVFFVDLAPLRDGTALERSVLDALGLAHEDVSALIPYLRDKKMLVVLDNCEHLVADCARLVDRLLAASSSLKIVATSREPLGVEGEVAYLVPPLPVPPEEAAGVEGLAPYAAAELFIDRARRAKAGFAPGDAEAEAIAEICRRLDGVPLAIELAAARVRALSPFDIAHGLGERFRLLAGGARTAMPRQQTLRASIDWSYNLLTEPERAVLRRLAVFAGSFNLDAARSVCAGDGVEAHQVVDLVSLLVDKSLVVTAPSEGETRFRMLETIREYAEEQLVNADEQRIRLRHCDYYRALLARFRTELTPWHDRIEAFDRDVDNIRAGIATARAVGDPRILVSYASAVTLVLAARTRWGAPQGWFADVVERVDEVGDEEQLEFCWVWLFGHFEPRLRPHVERLLSVFEERGDRPRVALAKFALARLDRYAVGGERFADLERALEDVRDAGDRLGEWYGLWTMRGISLSIPELDLRAYDRRIDELAQMLGPLSVEVVDFMKIGVPSFMNPRAALAALAGRTWSPMHERSARAYRAAALVATGAVDEARYLALEVLRDAEQVAHHVDAAIAHLCLGRLSAATGELEDALDQYRAASGAARQSAVWEAWAINAQAQLDKALVHLVRNDPERARHAIDNGSQLNFMSRMRARSDARLAVLQRHLGELGRAEDTLHRALRDGAVCGATQTVAEVLELLAGIAAAQESYHEAARLLGAAERLRDEIGSHLRLPPCTTWHDEDIVTIRAGLGDDAFEKVRAEGAGMSWQEAVAYAERGRGERKRPSSGWASLTPTERQVVDLVGQGLSNQEIGDRLFISARTVGSHLSHVYAKLGMSSRAELAAGAARRSATSS